MADRGGRWTDVHLDCGSARDHQCGNYELDVDRDTRAHSRNRHASGDRHAATESPAMFLVEAFTLSFLSTGIGTLVGLSLSVLFNVSDLHVPPGTEMFLMSNTFKFSLDYAHIFLRWE